MKRTFHEPRTTDRRGGVPCALVLRAQRIRGARGFMALLSGWLMASGRLQAHHSLAGVYDMKGEREGSGTVEKAQFVNPAARRRFRSTIRMPRQPNGWR
jgi:hypothetical protein